MSNFLNGLLDRALNQGTILQRRRNSRFEQNQQVNSGLASQLTDLNGIGASGLNNLNSHQSNIFEAGLFLQPNNQQDIKNLDSGLELKDKNYFANKTDVPSSIKEHTHVNQLETIRADQHVEGDEKNPFDQIRPTKQFNSSNINSAENSVESNNYNNNSEETFGLKETVEQYNIESTGKQNDWNAHQKPNKDEFAGELSVHLSGNGFSEKDGLVISPLEYRNSSISDSATQKRLSPDQLAQFKESQHSLAVGPIIHPVKVERLSSSAITETVNFTSPDTEPRVSTDSNQSNEEMFGIRPKQQTTLIASHDTDTDRSRNQFKTEMPRMVSPSDQANHQPTIHVSIGRIEIRANSTSAPKKIDQSRSVNPALKLDEYLKQRDGGSR